MFNVPNPFLGNVADNNRGAIFNANPPTTSKSGIFFNNNTQLSNTSSSGIFGKEEKDKGKQTLSIFSSTVSTDNLFANQSRPQASKITTTTNIFKNQGEYIRSRNLFANPPPFSKSQEEPTVLKTQQPKSLEKDTKDEQKCAALFVPTILPLEKDQRPNPQLRRLKSALADAQNRIKKHLQTIHFQRKVDQKRCQEIKNKNITIKYQQEQLAKKDQLINTLSRQLLKGRSIEHQGKRKDQGLLRSECMSAWRAIDTFEHNFVQLLNEVTTKMPTLKHEIQDLRYKSESYILEETKNRLESLTFSVSQILGKAESAKKHELECLKKAKQELSELFEKKREEFEQSKVVLSTQTIHAFSQPLKQDIDRVQASIEEISQLRDKTVSFLKFESCSHEEIGRDSRKVDLIEEGLENVHETECFEVSEEQEI